MRKIFWLFLFVAALFFIACPGSSESGDVATTDGASATAEEKVLVWNISSDPKSWDPQLNSATDGGHMLYNTVDGLYKDKGNGLEPAVATGHTLSDDGKVYTFTLRQDAKWSDGKPLTAHDFVYGITRLADPEAGSEYSNMATDFIAGATEYFTGEATRDQMGVKAIDDYTLELTLKAPAPFILDITNHYTYYPARQDIIEANGVGWEKNPATFVGTGAYKVTEYVSGSHIMLEKNEHYYDADSVMIDKIRVVMINEASTAFAGYETDEIHVIETVPTSEISRLIAEDPNFWIQPRLGTYYFNFNVDKAPMDNPLVRKALSLALDREIIVQEVTKGGQVPALGMVPPTVTYTGGTEAGRPIFGLSKNADLEQARALLAEAGYPNGEGMPELLLIYNTTEAHKAICEAAQQQWQEGLGVNVRLANSEWAVYQGTRRLGEFHIARAGWIGDYNDPLTMLQLFTNTAGYNDSQWRFDLQPVVAAHDTTLNPSNKEYVDLVNGSLTATGKERDNLLLDAERILIDEQAIVAPIYYYVAHSLVNMQYVQNVTRTAMGRWYFATASFVE